MDSVKHSLSALTRAEKLQEKAAELNFDWSDTAGIVAKIKEETSEVETALADNDDDAIDEELGDLLFAVINLIRYRKRSRSEDLLRRANGKFEQRFRIMENEAENAGLELADLSAEQLDSLWEKAKNTEK